MSQFKSSVAFAFSKDKKEGEKKEPESKKTPGPGQYTWDKIPKKKAPAIKMSQSKRPPLQKYCGPDISYPLQEFMGKEGPKYTMSSKAGKNVTIEKELAIKPAPSHYNPKIYSQYKTLGKNISFHKKISYKEIPDAPAPGQYNDKTGMITKQENQKYLQMSKTTRKYIENYGKVSHGTAKELLRPSTAPKYGFCTQQFGTDHGLTKEQLEKGRQQELKKKQQQEEQQKIKLQKLQEFKAKYNNIPKQKRKPDPNIITIELQQPKYGFGKYRKGQDTVQIRVPPKFQFNPKK